MKSKLEHYLEMAKKEKKKTEKSMTNKIDYSGIAWKLDKFMPDDPNVQSEFYDILDSGDVDALEQFLMDFADEDRMMSYMPKGGTVRGFAEYLIKNNI